jgi:hypothetical protein
MADIQAQLEQLLKTSFFLNPMQKQMIRITLKKASDEGKELLLNQLLEEKRIIKESLKQYLLKNGTEGIAKIKEILSKTQCKKIFIQEKESKTHEQNEMSKLLEELEGL